jgi:mono/diheme cytochrome c family protein
MPLSVPGMITQNRKGKTIMKLSTFKAGRAAHALGVVTLLSITAALKVAAEEPDQAVIDRGEYLVAISSCNDCHTPGYFAGAADPSRFLGGSDAGVEVPGLGVFVGPNLTPDVETGLGGWTTEDIVTALRTGVRPDGRILAPVMPWPNYSNLSDEDAYAVAAYLQTLDPISHKVPGPFNSGETVSTLMLRVLPPGQTAASAPE